MYLFENISFKFMCNLIPAGNLRNKCSYVQTKCEIFDVLRNKFYKCREFRSSTSSYFLKL